MVKAACSDGDFIDIIERLGPKATAKYLGLSERAIHHRRKHLSEFYNRKINVPAVAGGYNAEEYPARIECGLKNGIILIGADAHIWPGERSTAMKAFIQLIKDLKPKVVILNGDVLDFGRISKHQAIGWESTPMVHEEIEAAQDILHDIEMAAGRGVRKLWPLGNHDARYSTKLANSDPEYARIKGTRLKDHFPNWESCWSVFINNDIVIKHRFKGGIHATHNNTMWAGRTIVTGHLHSQKVTPFTDYSGTRWGVDCGCLAETSAKPFVNYTEDAPKNWVSGFCVLTIKDGLLLPPELVTVWNQKQVVWRGNLLKV